MKHHFFTALSLALLVVHSAPVAMAEAAMDTTTKAPDATMKEPGSLSAVIGDSVSFSILKKALIAADLDSTLGSKGAYTVFAPTDEAFDQLPAGLLGKLLLPENKEKLRSLLLYHVVAGKVLSTDLKDGEVKTLNGEKVSIDVDGATVEVDDAKVFSANVPASNGVIHTIGTVLIPKSLKDLSPLKD